jgi:hypothetical protein
MVAGPCFPWLLVVVVVPCDAPGLKDEGTVAMFSAGASGSVLYTHVK